MRYLPFLIALAFVGVAHAEIFTWVDADGVRHYSDSPATSKAEPADLPGLQDIQGDPQALERLRARQQATANAEAPDARTPRLVQPQPDATFRSGEGIVPVAVTVGGSGELRPGEQITYYLDGSPIPQSPTDRTQLQLGNVNRGSHTLSAALLYEGTELRRTEPVTFYVKPPSAISPLNANQGGGSGENGPDTPTGTPVAPPAGNSAGAPAAPRFNTITGPSGQNAQ